MRPWLTSGRLLPGLTAQRLLTQGPAVQLLLKTTNVEIAGSVGMPQLKQFHMVNIKQNLTSRQKRSRAAVDYSSCVCKSGGEAAQGSLPAQSPHSDQAISYEHSTESEGVRPGPGLKPQAASDKLQAPGVKLSNQPVQASSDKRQAPGSKLQASSHKQQAH